MRLLLTGATGFIGARALPLLAQRFELVCLARDPAALAGAPAEIIACDLAALDARRLPARIDAVLHLAQSARYRDFPAGAADMVAINVHATARLLDYALAAGADRFCLVSSGTVYEPYDGPIVETAALAPVSLNGATKLAAEALTRPYTAAMKIAALRLFFPYGPGQRARLIPDLIARVAEGRAVTVRGDDGLRLQPTYVDDIAALIARALADGWEGAVNVAAAEQSSIRDLAARIGARIGREPIFQCEAGAAPHVIADAARLAALAPGYSFTDLESGLAATIAAALEPAR